MRLLLGALAGLACACGSKDAPGETAAGLAPWGLPANAQSTASLDDCDTVIVIALDKVLRSELSWTGEANANGGGTPRLDSIAAGAQLVTDAVTISTAGNAALASLITGRHVTEHGIVSLRDAGFQTLSESEKTLAEGFAAAGWSTIFSSGSPLHARGFSGFSQGFEHYEAPRLAEPTRAAPSVVTGAVVPLKKALAENRPVFALLSFDDLSARALRPPSAEIAAPFVSAWLGPLAEERADIEAALRTLDANPEQGIEDFTKLLARARGSRASVAWNMALRAAHLSVVDDAIGDVLDELEAAGRAERALVVVTGLRGTIPPGYRHEAGALFTSDAIAVPLAIRWPGGAKREEPFAPTVSLLDVPAALAAVGEFELQPTTFRCADLRTVKPLTGVALVADSQRKLLAAVRGDQQVERYIDGQQVSFNRSGEQARNPEPDEWSAVNEGLKGFVAKATGISFSLALIDPALEADLRFAWESAPGPGTVVPAREGAKRPRAAVRGKFQMEDFFRELELTERGTAIRLGVSSASKKPIGPALLWIGNSRGSELPVMFTPSDDVPAPTADDEGPKPQLRLERSDGLWWTLAVDGSGDADQGAEAEVIVSVWPPRDLTDELEVSAGGGVQKHAVPGRMDLVRIVGTVPFTCRVKKLAKEDFTVACRLSSRFLEPKEMEFHGLRFAEPHAFECVFPHRQGEFSAELPSLEAALYGVHSLPDDPPKGSVIVMRHGLGPSPAEVTRPSVADLLELVRLVPGE